MVFLNCSFKTLYSFDCYSDRQVKYRKKEKNSMNTYEIACQHTFKSFGAPNSFTSNALMGHYSS